MTGERHYEKQSQEHWDSLHSQARFRPRYPNEHVVRFLLGRFPEPRRGLRALDIAVGGGRHTKLLCELGFDVAGIDISAEGIRHCQEWLATVGLKADLQRATMESLPFPDASFDAAIAYGVYCYADQAGMAAAIAQVHRVLRPGGSAFIMLRTTDDHRFGKGVELEPRTFRLTINDTNEEGTVQHFLGEADVPKMFRMFSNVDFEKTETTFGERKAINSDWLISIRK